jgi:drug/metabolite transporter (DMT)-like permease
VEFVPGDLWIAGAAVSWAAYSMLQKHWHSPLSTLARLAVICAGGVVVLVPFAAWELAQSGPALGEQALLLVVAAAVFPGCWRTGFMAGPNRFWARAQWP